MSEISAIRRETPASSGSRPRLEAVDVLRGLAALTVVFSHYFPHWDRYLGDVPVLVPGPAGNQAVRLFFVISGLVILMTLGKCRSVADFALLRFSRLYPTYWTTLILVALLTTGLFGGSVWMGGAIVNLTMFQEFLGFGNLDNVYWSLTVELAFYLNVAWLFALGLHRYPSGVVALWLCASGLVASTGDLSRDSDRHWLALLFALDFAPYFAAGIVLFRTLAEPLRRREYGLLLLAAVVEFLIASWSGLAVLCGATVLVGAAIRGRLDWAVTPPLLWLGSISYALYLIHRNLGFQLLDWCHGLGMGPVAAISLATAVSLALAGLVTVLVERPASRGLRRLYRL